MHSERRNPELCRWSAGTVVAMGGRGSGTGNPANLRPGPGRWQKGQSGNPYGRATRMTTMVTDALREILGSIDPETKKTFAKRIAKILVDCAINPDPELDKTRIMALSEIIDRCEGKPKQQLEVNDITAQLRERPTEDLMYHLEHGYWPEEEYERNRNKKVLARLEAAKPETDTTQ